MIIQNAAIYLIITVLQFQILLVFIIFFIIFSVNPDSNYSQVKSEIITNILYGHTKCTNKFHELSETNFIFQGSTNYY